MLDTPMDIKVAGHDRASFDAAHRSAVKVRAKRGLACKCGSISIFWHEFFSHPLSLSLLSPFPSLPLSSRVISILRVYPLARVYHVSADTWRPMREIDLSMVGTSKVLPFITLGSHRLPFPLVKGANAPSSIPSVSTGPPTIFFIRSTSGEEWREAV